MAFYFGRPFIIFSMILKYIQLFLFFIPLFLFSQNKIKDDFKYKVTYELTYALDSTELDSKKKDVMILLVGDDHSAFSSRSKFFRGELITKGNSGSTSKAAQTDFPYTIIKSLEDNKLFYTMRIVKDFFYYEQELDLFKWQLHDETKMIGDYKVQKATTTYAGREYIAWFTEEVPVSDGPFKFNGLPGLILEISDMRNHYEFKFASLERLEPKKPFKVKLKRYVKTTKKELFELRYRYRRDPFTYVNDPNITISPETHKKYIERFTEMLESENNPIEKN